MPSLDKLKGRALIIIAAVLVGSILVTFFAYHIASTSATRAVTPTAQITDAPAISPTVPTRALRTPTPTISPTLNPGSILGVNDNPGTSYPAIFCVRLCYPTCGYSY